MSVRRWQPPLVVVLVGMLLAGPTPAGADDVPGPLGGDLLGHRETVFLRQPGTPPPPGGITADGWLLADLGTGEVLAAHDAHARFAPASTLKTLTALTLIPRLAPERIVTATNAAAGADGSKVGLVPGHGYRVRQLLTALLVVSANDAGHTLAGAAGGEQRTVALMSAEAARLQARDTAARTVDGLDAAGQVSSAYDLALIAREAMRSKPFRQYVAVRRAFIPAPGGRRIEIATHNKLLRNYPGAIGVKNGYTVAAGATFIGAATRGGRTLVVTLLHASPLVWHEAAALLDWGFAVGNRVTPVGQLLEPLPEASATAAPAPQPVSAPRAEPGGGSPVSALGQTATMAWLAGTATGGLLVIALLGVRRWRRSTWRADTI